MAAHPKRRHGSGEWITRWLADNSDVRSVSDALAFLACGACVVALGYFALVIGGAL